MRRQTPILVLAAAVVALSACGGSEEPEPAPDPSEAQATEIPGDADPDDVRVIDQWATALREGDVSGAAQFFAIPSVAENGPIVVRIRNLGDARLFNASLPCGAELVRATAEGDFTIATFRLTERPGAGTCGSGTGATAQTAFVIESSKIAEWRRVGVGGEQAPSRSI